MRANRNPTRPALALAALLMLPVAAGAKDLETTHLFGFTLGSDVNDVGEIEGESETTGRFVRRAGSYGAIASELGLKFIPFDRGARALPACRHRRRGRLRGLPVGCRRPHASAA
jgi:hypothetical protein